jgi:hypothetical protein
MSPNSQPGRGGDNRKGPAPASVHELRSKPATLPTANICPETCSKRTLMKTLKPGIKAVLNAMIMKIDRLIYYVKKSIIGSK